MSEALLGARPSGKRGPRDHTGPSLCSSPCVQSLGRSCLFNDLILTRVMQGSCCYYPT